MIVGLLAAGAALCVCGLIALSFGLGYKEFSVGSTMIQAGVTLLGSGIVVVALAMVATELRKLGDALQGRRPASGAPRGRQLNIPEGLFPAPPSGEAPASGHQPASPQNSAGAQDDDVPSAGSPAMPPMRAPFVPEPIPEPKSFDAAWPIPPAGSASSEPAAAPAAVNPMLQPASPPAPERRSDMFRRSARASSLSGNPPPDDAAARPAAAPPPAPAAPPPAASVTILKSGVVDGMAYTLYSDGSIEAELADGKVRFASIEALRSHLDQRSN
jgi:hypothetical protein